MIPIIPTSSLFKSVDRQPFGILVQEFRTCRIVWKYQASGRYAENSNDALNDEEPAKTLKSAGTIDMSNTIGNGAAECAGEVAKGDDQSYAHCSLIVAIPNGDEVHNSRKESRFKLYFECQCNCFHLEPHGVRFLPRRSKAVRQGPYRSYEPQLSSISCQFHQTPLSVSS